MTLRTCNPLRTTEISNFAGGGHRPFYRKAVASGLAALLVGTTLPIGAVPQAYASSLEYVEVPEGYEDLTGNLVEAPSLDEVLADAEIPEGIEPMTTDDRIEMYADALRENEGSDKESETSDDTDQNTENAVNDNPYEDLRNEPETNEKDDGESTDETGQDDEKNGGFDFFSLPVFSFFQEQPANASEGVPFEADGNKIESINIKWIDNDGKSPRITLYGDTISAQAQIDAQLSGQHSYDVGDIQIEVPKKIFYDRTGSRYYGNFSFSVPQAPDSRAQFAYSELPDSFVLTNTKVIGAATSMRFKFTISGIPAISMNGNAKVLDTSDRGKNPSQPLYANISVRTHADSVIARRSGDIDAVIDTSAAITRAAATNQEQSVEVPDWLPYNLRPSNPDQYIYIRWYSWCNVSGNQPYDASFSARISGDGNGRILGYSTPSGGTVKHTGDATKIEKISLGKNLTDFRQTQYVSVYAAYEKSLLPNDHSYIFYEDADYEITSIDDKETTSASSRTYSRYSPTAWTDPTGRFDVYKYGGNTYPGTINRLVKGKDVLAEFRVQTVGIGAPWTLARGGDSSNMDDYGQRSYTMTTYDEDVKFDHDIVNNLTASDFDFEKLQFSSSSYSKWSKYSSGSSWGEWGWTSPAAGAADYVVWGKTGLSDNWVRMAELSNKGGSSYTSKAVYPGVSAFGGEIIFPPNTVTWKIDATTKAAALSYTVYPIVRIKASERNINRMKPLLYESDIPTTMVRNTAWSENFDDDGTLIVECSHKNADDYLTGIGSGASMDKKVLKVANDTSNQTVKLSYQARAVIASNLTSLGQYREAQEEGIISRETRGKFYDLLPAGVDPDATSVHGNSGSEILSVDTYRNWRGSGRTMMVVDMETGNCSTYLSSSSSPIGKAGYADAPYIEYDAYMSWASLAQYGTWAVNVAAYESSNPVIGTVKTRVGEPDDPLGGNNLSSASAVRGLESLMTGLDPEREGQKDSFVYARASKVIDVDTASLTSISKDVSVNGKGLFTDGLDEQHPQNVYEGGIYTYRIGMLNDEESSERDIVFFDSLENYQPTGDKVKDTGDKQWRGTVTDIDVSSLRAAGIEPVVYWSERDDLILDDRDNAADRDLSGSAGIWHKWTEDMTDAQKASVHAIAVDARKSTSGRDFSLGADKSIHFDIHMLAPTAKELSLADGGNGSKQERDKYYDTVLEENASEGDDEGFSGGAHAYNNAVMVSTHIDQATGAETGNQLVRKDYTKVGIVSCPVVLKKVWNDNENNDAARPDEISVEVQRNGEKVAEAVLDAESGWRAELDDLRAFDNNGQRIDYTVRESGSTERLGETIALEDAYNASVSSSLTSSGYIVRVANTHEPETTEVSGTKNWAVDERCTADDAAGESSVRPSAIKLDIYADGKFYQSQIVQVSDSEKTEWSFTGLPKWKEGKLIAYTVEEDLSYREADRWYAAGRSSAGNENNLVNTYYPYGDIVIEKKATNSVLSDANRNTEFSFALELTYEREGADGIETVPDAAEYALVVEDESGNIVSEEDATVSNGSVILLHTGEKAHIVDVPTRDYYKIEEIDIPDGWTLTNKTNDSGYVKSGNEASGGGARVVFSNTYKASGKMYLNAAKRLENRELGARKFMLRLTDSNGTVIRSAANKAPDGEDGHVGISQFGAISYTESDIGKTFEYSLFEEDRGLAGHEYATGKFRVIVNVEDNGDGTLDVQTDVLPVEEGDKPGVSVARAGDIGIDGGAAGILADDIVPVFTNTYRASGALEMKAFKELKGRELKDREFEFELVEIDGEGNAVDGGESRRARNDAAGNVSFGDVLYDEQDIGKTIRYRVSEVAGNDDTVIYDDYSFVYAVTVYDRGAGTLSFDQMIEKGEDVSEKEPVFRNTLRPGGLVIQKEIDPEVADEDWDPNTEFEFEVQLEGTDIDDGTYDYELAKRDPEDDAWGEKEAFAIYTEEDSTLRFYKRNKNEIPEETEEYEGHMVDKLITGIEDEDFECPWRSWCWYNLEIVDCISPKTTRNWFYTNTSWASVAPIFEGFCGNTLDLRKLDMSNVKDASNMFYVQDLYDLGPLSLNISDWDTSNIENMEQMFYGTLSRMPGKLDLTSWDVSNVQNMKNMFAVGKLAATTDVSASLDVSGWDTRNVTDMSGMFSYAYNSSYGKGHFTLESLDVSGWDTRNVTDMSSMFEWCNALKMLDLSSWDTSNVENMNSLFENTIALQTIYVSDKWNLNKCTSSNWMFNHYVGGGHSCSLVGGKGTYCWGQDDYGEYARIDNPPDEPGFFTYKAAPEQTTSVMSLSNDNDNNAPLYNKSNTVLPSSTDSISSNTDDTSSSSSKSDLSTPQIGLFGVEIPPASAEENIIISSSEYIVGYQQQGDGMASIASGIVDERLLGIIYDNKIKNLPALASNDIARTIIQEKNSTARIQNVNTIMTTVNMLSADSNGNTLEPTVIVDDAPGTMVINEEHDNENTIALASESLDGSGYSITYHAGNNGEFHKSDGSVVKENTVNYKYFDVTKYAHTKNLDDSGEFIDGTNSGYGNNMNETQVITIPGAEKLTVELTYQTESTSFDWVCLYDKNTEPLSFNYSSSITGKLGGTTKKTETFEIPGDTVQIYFKSDESNSSYYGYYAKVSGAGFAVSGDTEYLEPVRVGESDLRFRGWSKTEGSSISDALLDGLESDVYAVWTPLEIMYEGQIDGCSWTIDEFGELKIFPTNGVSGTMSNPTSNNSSYWAWLAYKNIIKTAGIAPGVIIQNASRMFESCSSLESLDVSGWDTSNIKDMSSMFSGCSSLKSLDLSSWNTSNVTDMAFMFEECSSLESVDVSGWDTSNVTNMNNMFYLCQSLLSVNTSKWNTSNITDMSYMFSNCSQLLSIDVSGWDTSNVTNMTWMFYGCTSLSSLDVSNWDTSNITNMSNMFNGCPLSFIDVGEWDTSNVTNINGMFSSNPSLKTIDVSNWDTSNVRYMPMTFHNCPLLASVDVSNWDTSNVTNTGDMFSKCESLVSLDLSGWNTGSIQIADTMFKDCSSLLSIDVSNWDTSSVTNMNSMFYGCRSLSSLDVSGWDTSSVTNMNSMFSGCSSLESLDVSGWDTSKVLNTRGMFSGCSSLVSLDLSGWDTSNIQEMSDMFSSCFSLLSLDLSSWNTRNVRYMKNMFSGCESLTQISVSNKWTTSNLYFFNSSDNMFSNCKNITGGDGTIYDPNHTDAKYAHIDNLPDDPGYFTLKESEPRRIRYNSNGATGSITDQNITDNMQVNICTYYYANHKFVAWNTKKNGTGDTYYPGDTPVDIIESNKNIVILYAQWEETLPIIDINNGKFTIKLHADERAYIPNLPAGTTYTIREINNNPGWSLSACRNTTGTIQSLTDSVSPFRNTYKPNLTTISLMGMKTFDGTNIPESNNELAQLPFSFSLIDDNEQSDNYGNEIETIESDKSGIITFSDMEFTEAGTYKYKIRENTLIDGNIRDDIIFDEHEEHITVEVTDDGHGYLSSKVIYEDSDNDTDGRILFNNQSVPEQPASLTLIKNLTSASPIDQKFSFRIKFDSALIPDRVADIEVPAGQTSASLPIDDLPLHEPFTIIEELSASSPYRLASCSPEDMRFSLNGGQEYSAEFTNEYSARGYFTPEAVKKMSGVELHGGEFHFGLFDTRHNAVNAVGSGNMDTAIASSVNAADSHIYFDAIEINSAGFHEYFLAEVPTNDSGDSNGSTGKTINGMDIAFDKTIYKVVVNATDNGDGTLSCNVSYENIGKLWTASEDDNIDEDNPEDTNNENQENLPVFTNSIDGGKLIISKSVSGVPDAFSDLVDGVRFDVRVWINRLGKSEENEDTTDSASNENGIAFKWMNYSNGDSGLIHSGETVPISDGQEIIIEIPNGCSYRVEEVESGLFKASYEGQNGQITGRDDAYASIENKFDPFALVSLSARKLTEGFNLGNGQFSFVLMDENGSVIDEVRNGNIGEVEFPEMRVDFDTEEKIIEPDGNDNGEDEKSTESDKETGENTDTDKETQTATVLADKIYRIYEIEDGQPGITYDSRFIEARVKATPGNNGAIETSVEYFYNGEGSAISDDVPAFKNASLVSLPITGLSGYTCIIGFGLCLIALGLGAVELRRRKAETNGDEDRSE